MSHHRNPLQASLALAFGQKLPLLRAGMSASLLAFASGAIHAQTTDTLPTVDVTAKRVDAGYAADPAYRSDTFSSGPLGNKSVMDTAASVTTVPEDLIINTQAKTVNDTLRYLPSVIIRNQQGYEVSRPQSRGFMSSVVQNTRLDGLSVVGTTAIAGENLAGIEVLNGLGGVLYGPQTPAGVFNYVLKRPTDEPLRRVTLGYEENSVWTTAADLGGRGDNGAIGYRINAVHGEGESWAPNSSVNRSLASVALDFHVSPKTVIETNLSYYDTDIRGLPGSIVYDTNTHAVPSTMLPPAVDPTRVGLGQPGAGTNLRTTTELVKVKHEINDQWNLEVGGLHQDSFRGLYGITNTMQNDFGNFKVTKNFTAIPHYTIVSNSAYLNGKVDIGGFKNELTFGTNGFTNGQYSYRNSIAVSNPTVLNLSNPQVLTFPATPANGGEYRSGTLVQQSFIAGDMFHFNDKYALQGVLNVSNLTSQSFDKNGNTTSRNENTGEVSPTLSFIYKPTTSLMTYVTAARSVEQGEQAPTGTANANQFMDIYHDKLFEVGTKYSVNPDLMLTMAAFHMTRPLASTDLVTNVFHVIGTQVNNGLELFAQGNLARSLSIFGGVTYIDARANGTGNPATDNKMVVGVPHLKSDITLDYHPAYLNGLAFTGTMHHESARAATNTNNSYAPQYTTWDVGTRYTTGIGNHHFMTARLQVLNLTNKFYYSAIADGNIVGSPGANTAYLAPPRTIMATLSFDY